jgi:WD40 repeat protein/3',5'-cyclic AMP phosphodiesterase CpdA/transcriptional regulator with XRE-family HTH domain
MNRIPVDDGLAARLGNLRAKRRLSQEKLATECARAGAATLTRTAISKIEAKIRSVGVNELDVLARILGVTPEQLLDPSFDPKHAEPVQTGQNSPATFFVSYSPADECWATWIAWELEQAGYRTILQVWDFVPGANFIEFMDRGVTEASVVIAVLSKRYMKSRWGRLEWQTAIHPVPEEPGSRLITVRIEDCELDGFLSTITYVDLVGVVDPAEARRLLLERIRHALLGRAKPATRPGYPLQPVDRTPVDPLPHGSETTAVRDRAVRRLPVRPPVYPPSLPPGRTRIDAVTVLHVPGPRFGRQSLPEPLNPTAQQDRVWAEVTHLIHGGAPPPDILVVTGDLTETGSRREFDAALAFLLGLRALLQLEPHRVVLVPGRRDVSRPACSAYFAFCEADDREPYPPYWPKWRHYARTFAELYEGVEGVLFDTEQPWSVFAMPDLKTVVAGFNSTIAQSHREADDFGLIGEAQAARLAHQLRTYEETGWLRIGAVHHSPQPPHTAADDVTFLRDTQDFNRIVAPRLNLLLAGTGNAGARKSESCVVVTGAGTPDTVHLLEIKPDGLRRWEGEPGPVTAVPATGTGVGSGPVADRYDHRWLSVEATFDAVPAELESGGGIKPSSAPDDGGAPAPDPRLAAATFPDRLGELLQRIVEIYQTSHERLTIRRVVGDAPHLVVTYPEDGFTRQVRVGAHLGSVTRDDIDAFERYMRDLDLDADTELICEVPPPPGLRQEAMRRGIRVRSFIEFQGLLDLRDYVGRQTSTLATDRQYPPDLYVPQRFRELVGTKKAVREGLVEELLTLLADPNGRFILLLGDFGRGKTFAMREVTRRIPEELPHLTPILIDLGALDKAHSMEGLVAAHLANDGYTLSDLRAFRYMLAEGRIVLLFDGFDELATRVTYERAADHLDTLIHASQGNAKIIVASRTHHFQNDAQVLTALGQKVGLLPRRQVLRIEDFGMTQIRTYLINRYGGDEAAADTRITLIKEIRDLIGLSRNPRMLSFIADLPQERLATVARARGAISAAQLYQEILDYWLAYEAERTQSIPGAPAGLGKDELWRAVTALALRLWDLGESFLRLAQIHEVAETLTELAEGRPSPEQATHAIGSGSLLIRTDEGLFGFIHFSVVEWLVAKKIAEQLPHVAKESMLLARRKLSALAVDFLCDLVDAGTAQKWAATVLADGDADDLSRTNALRISHRLRTPMRTDLRGASLQGEDLSYREMREVDLAEADLTDAQLDGTDLAGAVLRNTKLVRTHLDGATLTGADLTGADLTEARLCGADLQNAAFVGVRWRRAALIGVRAEPALIEAARAGGAAIAPGYQVEVGLAPPTVSVNFGFESGRIPQPVAYSPDGLMMVVASEDGGALICDASGQPLRTLQSHHGRVHAVYYGNKILATGSTDGTVRLWDPLTGGLLGTLGGHKRWVWPLVPSPDGSRLAVGDASGVVRVWNVATQDLQCVCPGHGERVWTAAFNPDGSILAIGDETATVRLWDPIEGRLINTLDDQDGSVFRLAFSPDGATLATADQAGLVRLWDVKTGSLRTALHGHERAVYTLDFHPHEPLLASGDTSGTVRLWDLNSDSRGYTITKHTGAVYHVCFSPDGSTLASGDSDGVLRLTNPATGALLHELTGHKGSVWPMAIRPDGRHIVTASNDGTARIWEVDAGTCVATVSGHGRRRTSVRFSADGARLAVCSNDGTVRLWDPKTGQRRGELTGVPERLISAIFTPVGRRVAATSSAGTIHVWNLEDEPAHDIGGTGTDDGDTGEVFETGIYERELSVDTDHVWAEAFSPDGDILATANDDDTVQFWYRKTGRHIVTIADHKGRVRSVAFSPDGRILATGCDDRLVRLWEVPSGQPLTTLPGHTDRVYFVGFTPDGSMLASASNDGTARLWDAASGELVHVLAGHDGRLWTAGFSPNGRLLATAGDDLVIKLWDTATGRHLATLAGHTRRVWSVDFSPDGELLASCGDDGTARLWRLADIDHTSAGIISISPHLTLIGIDRGWAALAPDGKYKVSGDIAGQAWFMIGSCRFELGELDRYLSDVRRLAIDAQF